MAEAKDPDAIIIYTPMNSFRLLVTPVEWRLAECDACGGMGADYLVHLLAPDLTRNRTTLFEDSGEERKVYIACCASCLPAAIMAAEAYAEPRIAKAKEVLKLTETLAKAASAVESG